MRAKHEPERKSEAFEKPSAGAVAGLPKGDLAAVRRRDRPAEFHLRFLEGGGCVSVKIYLEQSFHA